MKNLKKIAAAIFSLPLVLARLWVGFQIFGFWVNHRATDRQTRRLRENLEREIPGVEILSTYSETGNTSGTGNHVDCLSAATFSSDLEPAEIENRLSDCYTFDGVGCYITESPRGGYTICITSSAPFPDNIEGH